jgi:CHAT domain-containing protein
MDLLRALRDVKPAVVHFAGHARTDGIYLTGEDGRPARVTGDALLSTFSAAGQSVQIVVLNGCSTEELAKRLCELVPVCVGTSASIGDDAARTFSIGFYGALASSESVAVACLHGKAAMHLDATGDHDRPRLHHRRDVDPDKLVLADDKGPVAPAPIALASPPTPVAPASPPARAVAQPPAAAVSQPAASSTTG